MTRLEKRHNGGCAQSGPPKAEPSGWSERPARGINIGHQIGTLYGIGVGPGDPGLITVKGLSILKSVPAVYVPKSREEAGSFALSIVEGYLDRSRQEVIDLVFPMCKDREGLASFWDRSVALIAERLERGLSVACIAIGDPLLYSTFTNVLERILQRDPNQPVEIVPGVTSISACSARAGRSLAIGDQRISIIPATYHPKILREEIESHETVVLMKVNRVMDEVILLLREMDLLSSSIFISRCGTPQEEVVTEIETLAGRTLDYQSMLIIHRRRSA